MLKEAGKRALEKAGMVEEPVKEEAAPAWMDLLEWTRRYRAQLIPDRYFDLSEHPYLAGIYSDEAPEIVLYKAGQMGISEYLVSFAIHACDIRNANVMYVFPNDGDVSDFSAARLGPAIEASRYLESIVFDGSGKGGKRGSDKVKLKRFRNRHLYFRGATVKPDGNAAQLKSVDADVIILDELDEMDQRAQGIVRKRLGHSQINLIRLASTPTYHGLGIHAAYQDSRQTEWEVTCPAVGCGYKQFLSIANVVQEWDKLERPVTWHKDADGNAFIGCMRCDKPIPWRAIADGRWVAKYPTREVQGYHVPKWLSNRLDLNSIITSLGSTNTTTRKEVFNQDLGLPFKPRGSGLTDADLDAVKRDYGFGKSGGGLPVYMGVDVGRVHNVVIREAPDPETGERKMVHAEQAESFERVIALISQFNPARVVIDALPETTKSRDVQAAFPRRKVWVAYYVGQIAGNKKVEEVDWDYGERRVIIDRTRMFDAMYQRFFDGVNTLPAFANEITDYYSQLKAPVRITEKTRDGNSIARYVEAVADHYAHAELYCAAASLKSVTGAKAGKLDY